jgi:hypothetical protein
VESGIYFIPFTIEDLGLSCGIVYFLKKGGLAKTGTYSGTFKGRYKAIY